MGRMDLQAVVYDLISKYELCKRERESSKTMTCLGLVAFYPEGDDGVKVIAIESGPAYPAIPLSEHPLATEFVTGIAMKATGNGSGGDDKACSKGDCKCQT